MYLKYLMYQQDQQGLQDQGNPYHLKNQKCLKFHLYPRDLNFLKFLKYQQDLRGQVNQLHLKNQKYLKYHLYLKVRMNHLYLKFHLFLVDLVDLLGL
jgi:hypothetical protein